MTKFLSESNEIISADFRIKSVRDNFTHMRRYLVCFYYPEDKETPEYEKSEETGHTLATFPENPEGHACAKDLMNLETEKRGNAASMLTGHPSRTGDAADSLTPSVVRPLSLPIIQERIGIVNQKERFEQSAWHGTPHDFDGFDIGAIGTGEGAQTHGWGLYFAQNREVSEWYKAVLGEVQQAIIHAGDKTNAHKEHAGENKG